MEPTACLIPAYTQKGSLSAFPTGPFETDFMLFGAEILFTKILSLLL